MGKIPSIDRFQNATPKQGAIAGHGYALVAASARGPRPEWPNPNGSDPGRWTRDIGPVLAEHLLETVFGRVTGGFDHP
jgi:hypothetical protein